MSQFKNVYVAVAVAAIAIHVRERMLSFTFHFQHVNVCNFLNHVSTTSFKATSFETGSRRKNTSSVWRKPL